MPFLGTNMVAGNFSCMCKRAVGYFLLLHDMGGQECVEKWTEVLRRDLRVDSGAQARFVTVRDDVCNTALVLPKVQECHSRDSRPECL